MRRIKERLGTTILRQMPRQVPLSCMSSEVFGMMFQITHARS